MCLFGLSTCPLNLHPWNVSPLTFTVLLGLGGGSVLLYSHSPDTASGPTPFGACLMCLASSSLVHPGRSILNHWAPLRPPQHVSQARVLLYPRTCLTSHRHPRAHQTQPAPKRTWLPKTISPTVNPYSPLEWKQPHWFVVSSLLCVALHNSPISKGSDGLQ